MIKPANSAIATGKRVFLLISGLLSVFDCNLRNAARWGIDNILQEATELVSQVFRQLLSRGADYERV
jgi:hypothetical protein